MVGVCKGIAQSPQRQQLEMSGDDELSLVAITVYRMTA
jgi:hypothetical protein